MKRVLLFAALVTAACSSASAGETTLKDYSYAARLDLQRRIGKVLQEHHASDTIVGTVTYAQYGCFYLQGTNDSLKVLVDRGDRPSPGDVVAVKGRPELEGGRVVLAAESWTRTGTDGLPSPRKVGVRDLLFVGSGEKDRAKDVNWMLVEIRGRAVALTESGFAIEVDGLPVTVSVEDVPGFIENCAKTRPVVTVKGVAELILDQSTLFGRNRQVMGVKLCVASGDDIVLEPDLEYLLNCRDRRVMALVAALIVLLSLGLFALLAFTIRQGRRQLRTKTLMNERKRMADDLHDTIEQHLVGAGMLLQLQRTKEAQEILVRAKREMRDIVWGLKNDDMMRLSPAEMVKELAKVENRKGLYRVTARLEGMPANLDAGQMRDLSLVVREAIGNAVKHGGAKKIAISSDPLENGGWMLRIGNDGTPFDEATAPGVAEGHFGVEGMRQRARRLGADLAFSRKGEWTVLTLRVEKEA